VDVYEFDWPRWAQPLLGASAVVVGLLVATQRLAYPNPGLSTALVALAVLPWVLTALNVRIPMWICPAVVIGCVLALLRQPVNNDFAPFLLVLGAGTSAIVFRPVASIPLAAAAAGGMVGYELAGVFQSAAAWVFGIFFAWFLGFAFRYQLKLYLELQCAQEGLAAKAATDERQRVAREVHDVIAHSLSVTMLHLTGARLALQSGERDEALEALADAERAGREAMGDIRRTVGLLSPSTSTNGAAGAPVPAPPEPAAADIVDLVSAYRGAGLDVEFAVRGKLTNVSPTVGLALYRIAQESLANVAKHAPGAAARITVDVANGSARLTTRNPASGSQTSSDEGGLGLRGMRERTELLGGTFRAGPDDGAWEVQAIVPLGT